MTPAFRFCLSNFTVSQVAAIHYSFFLFVTQHCNTYTYSKPPHNLTIDSGGGGEYNTNVILNRAVHICKAMCFFCGRFTLAKQSAIEQTAHLSADAAQDGEV